MLPGAVYCWLCGERVQSTENDAAAAAAPVVAASFAQAPKRFFLASLLIFVTVVCVALGVTTIAPGIGIPLGLILLIVWLPAGIMALPRQSRPKASTALTSSGVVMLAIFAIVGIAALAIFVAFLQAC